MDDSAHVEVKYIKGNKKFSVCTMPREEANPLEEGGIVKVLKEVDPPEEPAEKPSEPLEVAGDLDVHTTDTKVCKGSTKSGEPCSRVADETGFCFQHGPDEEE